MIKYEEMTLENLLSNLRNEELMRKTRAEKQAEIMVEKAKREKKDGKREIEPSVFSSKKVPKKSAHIKRKRCLINRKIFLYPTKLVHSGSNGLIDHVQFRIEKFK